MTSIGKTVAPAAILKAFTTITAGPGVGTIAERFEQQARLMHQAHRNPKRPMFWIDFDQPYLRYMRRASQERYARQSGCKVMHLQHETLVLQEHDRMTPEWWDDLIYRVRAAVRRDR